MMSEQSKWKEMLDEFRVLGGVAENVELRQGSIGRGLFPLDPKLPTKVVIPDNLLISTEEIEFENDKIRIKNESHVRARARALFEFFENDFSWGAGGKQDCEAFFGNVDALPESVRSVLVQELDLPVMRKGNGSADRVQKRYISSRMMAYGDGHVLMPVLGLVNHGVSGCAFDTKSGVAIQGVFEGEVLARYNVTDAYGAFQMWGFASKEPIAFSLPATLKLETRQLTILRQIHRKKKQENFRVPVLESDDDQVRVSHLMLGNEHFPRLSKGIFYSLMRDIGEANSEVLLDQIRRLNIKQFLKLIEALEGHEGPLISTLRRMCLYQISAITHSIGTREI